MIVNEVCAECGGPIEYLNARLVDGAIETTNGPCGHAPAVYVPSALLEPKEPSVPQPAPGKDTA